ncbi:hypothetical protein PILCRDRAFT_819109, partial [Piloderma croceum F 1598]
MIDPEAVRKDRGFSDLEASTCWRLCLLSILPSAAYSNAAIPRKKNTIRCPRLSPVKSYTTTTPSSFQSRRPHTLINLSKYLPQPENGTRKRRELCPI